MLHNHRSSLVTGRLFSRQVSVAGFVKSNPYLFAVIGILWLNVAMCEASEGDASYSLALDSIKTETIAGHVGLLADDRLEGRESGSHGGRAAGKYLVEQFSRYKLAPAGDKNSYFQNFPYRYRNVLAQLPGSDPKLQYEIILIGAHYDHVGRGSSRNSRGRPGEIHNGADDNASGTSGLLELAEAFSMLTTRPKRTILFVAWDAEEKGMLGSKYWAAHPTVPMDNVVLAINMDMIGRLRDETVQVFGTRSGFGLRRLLAEHNPGFTLAFDWTTKPNADHWPLFDKEIPYVMFHTGKHPQYHTQDDDVELINNDGIRRLMRFVFATVYDAANAERVTRFRSAARYENNRMRRHLSEPNVPLTPRLGVHWRESTESDKGIQLTGVQAASPAAAARLLPGDRIVQLGEQKINTSDELRWAIFHASGPTRLVVHRPDESEPREITAELPRQQLRVGITWRVDSASPGTVILTQVAPGSPAAVAGLTVGDRVYQIDGKDFDDEQDFAERLKELPGPVELLIERQGHLESVTMRFDAVPFNQAA